jgi:hypothetical protein
LLFLLDSSPNSQLYRISSLLDNRTTDHGWLQKIESKAEIPYSSNCVIFSLSLQERNGNESYFSATFSGQINKPLHSLRHVTAEYLSRIKFAVECQQEMMGWNLNEKNMRISKTSQMET